jgi:hypothetical protein
MKDGLTASCMRLTGGGQPCLPIGGDKTGQDRWYEEHVPLADAIYDRHLRELDED